MAPRSNTLLGSLYPTLEIMQQLFVGLHKLSPHLIMCFEKSLEHMWFSQLALIWLILTGSKKA